MSRMFDVAPYSVDYSAHDYSVLAKSYLLAAMGLQQKIESGTAHANDSGFVTHYFLRAADHYGAVELSDHALRCRKMSACYSRTGDIAYEIKPFSSGFTHHVLFQAAEMSCQRWCAQRAQQVSQSKNPPAPSYLKTPTTTYSHNPYAPVLF